MPSFPPGVHRIGGQNAAAVNRQLAEDFYRPILPLVVELRQRGLSLRAIARELDRRGIKTRQEWDHWSATQVRRVLARRPVPTAEEWRALPASQLLADAQAIGFGLHLKDGKLQGKHLGGLEHLRNVLGERQRELTSLLQG